MIARELLDYIYILKNSYYMEYLKEPSYIILAPWMISILSEEAKWTNHFQHVQGGDIDTVFGIIIIETPKVKEFNDIEVY
jgi:hypothetical protein